MLVKICGVRDLAGARAAAEADFVGFNFVPGRGRCITATKARELAAEIGAAVPIGVFQDQPLDAVRRLAEAAGLGWIQLHGAEPATFGEALSRRFSIVRALHLGTLDEALDWAPFTALFVVDGRAAGSGQRWAWDAAPGPRLHGRPVLLAGGLDPLNVGAAIRAARPSGVDTASGVEADGAQSPRLIGAFIAAAKEISS